MSTISRDNYMPADRVITIAALDCREDWWDAYVEAVEGASGLSYTHDDSQYGVFEAFDGNLYKAFIREDLSNDETWVVDLDLIEEEQEEKTEEPLKTYAIGASGFITPPENYGQIVEVSYAYAVGEQVIIERVHDRSDRTTSYYAYEDGAVGADWDPWNGTPALGKRLGECQITDDDE